MARSPDHPILLFPFRCQAKETDFTSLSASQQFRALWVLKKWRPNRHPFIAISRQFRCQLAAGKARPLPQFPVIKLLGYLWMRSLCSFSQDFIRVALDRFRASSFRLNPED
jgi:hypothetical protein